MVWQAIRHFEWMAEWWYYALNNLSHIKTFQVAIPYIDIESYRGVRLPVFTNYEPFNTHTRIKITHEFQHTTHLKHFAQDLNFAVFCY